MVPDGCWRAAIYSKQLGQTEGLGMGADVGEAGSDKVCLLREDLVP